MTDLDPPRLAAIQAREQVATKGPWETQERDDRERGVAVIAVHPDLPRGSTPTRGMVAWVGQGGANFGKPPTQAANAEFIAHARTDIPYLLAALARLQAARDEAVMERSYLRAVVGEQARIITLKSADLIAAEAARDEAQRAGAAMRADFTRRAANCRDYAAQHRRDGNESSRQFHLGAAMAFDDMAALYAPKASTGATTPTSSSPTPPDR